MAQHRFTGDRVQNFGEVRFHARAFARGEYYDIKHVSSSVDVLKPLGDSFNVFPVDRLFCI
jgi:hypothetical protein